MDKKDVECIYIMEFCSTIKKNEILLSATRWMDLRGYYAKCNKSEKGRYYMVSLMGGIKELNS